MQSSLGSPTASSIAFFFLIVVLTLVVTYWAARRTKTSSEFYAAGRSVSALQNGFALAGDYMSAASFLGISGMVALQGYDGMIYATGWLVGWPALMFLVAEPLRNLGKFTFADVVAFRLQQRPVRIAAAVGGILTVLFYTIAQMVGSGQLINLMFGIPYEWAEIIVGTVMLAYVLFGGMLATTWVQIIKAVLLLIGVTVLTALVHVQVRLEPREPLHGGVGQVRPGGARSRAASSRAPSRPSRWGWPSCSGSSACPTSSCASTPCPTPRRPGSRCSTPPASSATSTSSSPSWASAPRCWSGATW